MTTPQMSTLFGIKISALFYLIQLYLKEPVFNKEFHELMSEYDLVVDYYLLGWINSHRSAFPLEQYKTISRKLGESLSDHIVTVQRIDEYLSALDDLAWKWKLRTPKPLAGFLLFIQAFAEKMFSFGKPVLDINDFHLLSINPPLHLTVKDMDMIDLGQTKLLEIIKHELKDYSKQLKKAGVKKYPYELKRHASWWFEHYVMGKPYTEIDEGAETVKRKVWEFRKLLNIRIKS